MATSIIEQEPKYYSLPVGQPIIFVISNDTAVANESNVMFFADVHISSEGPPNLSVGDKIIGRFQTTPNNKGVGMFDFSSVVENFVSADVGASPNAKHDEFGAASATLNESYPIHIIDKYSYSLNSVRFMKIQFGVQYLDTTSTPPAVVVDTTTLVNTTGTYKLMNGYLKETDELETTSTKFGYNIISKFALATTSKSFLSNMPTTLYCDIDDYGTIAMYTPNSTSGGFTHMELEYVWGDGSGSQTVDVNRGNGNGAWAAWSLIATNCQLYFSPFPANLNAWEPIFQGEYTSGKIKGGLIRVRAMNGVQQYSKQYTIKVNCDEEKGYEPIRLAWLNQWGAYDYWTFNKKSIKSINTSPTTWNQLSGTWGESKYAPRWQGGEKNLRMNSKERYRINTDFIGEEYNVMFEEMINSPIVYKIRPYHLTNFNYAHNSKLVQSVRVLTNSFTKKTRANDKLIQYGFEIELSKTLKTQSV